MELMDLMRQEPALFELLKKHMESKKEISNPGILSLR